MRGTVYFKLWAGSLWRDGQWEYDVEITDSNGCYHGNLSRRDVASLLRYLEGYASTWRRLGYNIMWVYAGGGAGVCSAGV